MNEWSKVLGRKDPTDWGMLYFESDSKVIAERRIADQINWFNKRSQQNRDKFTLMKGSSFVLAGLVTLSPVIHSFHILPVVATSIVAVFGATIMILERLLQMNDCRGNWLSYRQTCEELKHEKFLYLSQAGPYEGHESPDKLLARRSEKILYEARRQWLEVRQGEEQFDNKIAAPFDQKLNSSSDPTEEG